MRNVVITAVLRFYFSSPSSCSSSSSSLIRYYLGLVAGEDMKLSEMEKWMVWALEIEPETPVQVLHTTTTTTTTTTITTLSMCWAVVDRTVPATVKVAVMILCVDLNSY